MTGLEIFLLVTTSIFLASTAIAIRLLYKLGVIMLKVEDQLESSLEIVDGRIDAMQKILEVPLFSDSPEIKRIHTDMMTCKDALIGVANSLTNSAIETVEEETLELK